ncbi:rhomboid family intramembrane serine protease [Nocardioides sp. 1609]|uniref:rhomboid family intramembrane serine protease n=1 Tax=Nocardioides sp. 1609 TaxID=2508327 RepID=UPI00106F8B73|nr:rhomboid family intramembrane serine protease [Nocardioides sp. 1609]
MRTQQETGRRSPVAVAALGAGGFVALLWLIEIIDALADHRLDQYGVRPRSDEGLVGILVAPLLHGGWLHLEANTLPALVLLFLVLVTGVARGLQATAVIWVVGGLGVWLVAPSDTVHLGASVLVFGWLVHLVLRGVFNRRVREILLGVALLVVYGSVLLGVLPGEPGISWQGHLFGALGGALAAFLLAERERTVV